MLKLKNGEVVMKALLKVGTVLTSALYLFPSMATAQDQPPATTPTQSIASRGSAEAVGGDRLGDIVVTARRREENAQTVPVSVTAFSGAALEQRNVHELQDLNLITPGLRFSAEGGKTTTTVIRSEERRVGKECGRTGKSRWWREQSKNNTKEKTEH